MVKYRGVSKSLIQDLNFKFSSQGTWTSIRNLKVHTLRSSISKHISNTRGVPVGLYVHQYVVVVLENPPKTSKWIRKCGLLTVDAVSFFLSAFWMVNGGWWCLAGTIWKALFHSLNLWVWGSESFTKSDLFSTICQFREFLQWSFSHFQSFTNLCRSVPRDYTQFTFGQLKKIHRENVVNLWSRNARQSLKIHYFALRHCNLYFCLIWNSDDETLHVFLKRHFWGRAFNAESYEEAQPLSKDMQ